MGRKGISAEKATTKNKKVKRAQESSDTSDLNYNIEENNTHSKIAVEGKEEIAMHKLSGLAEAAKIVESVPPTEGKPGRRKSKNPQKTRTAVVKPTQKSGKGAKKLKGLKQKADSDADESNNESDSESDDSDYIDSENYEALKSQVTLLMSKLEKMENTKKRNRKRKTKKEKQDSADIENKEVDEKPPKSQKKGDGSKKELTDMTTSVAPDNNVMFQIQYQQMMLQQMYMNYGMMPPYPPFPTYLPPNMISQDAGTNSQINVSSSAAMILPGTPTKANIVTAKVSASSISHSNKEKSSESYVNVDIHSNSNQQMESTKDSRKSKGNHNDYESDASEVYEPDVVNLPEQKSSGNAVLISQLPSEIPTPSFLNFCDNMTTDDNGITTSTKTSQLLNIQKDKNLTLINKQPIVNKENSISVENERISPRKDETKKPKEPVGSNYADVLMNLIPKQVRKEINVLNIKEKEEDTSEINTSLKSMLAQYSNMDGVNQFQMKKALIELLTENMDESLRKRPPPLVPSSKSGPPPLERHKSYDKSHDDGRSWLHNCLRNLHLQDQDGDTILHVLIAKEDEQGAIEVIKRMKGYRMDILNALGQTPLHLAMYIKNISIIEALLQHGADIRIVDAHGNSPLHIACEENSLQLVQVLFDYHLSHRAKYQRIMQIRNNQGLAAVHIATQKENEDILRFLIRHKIDLNIQEGRSGNTPLVMALSKANWRMADFFMENGADVNIANFSNLYPLHFAVQGNNMPAVKNLLNRGAEMGSKANEYDNGKDSEIKSLLAKEMRKRRRQKARNEGNP